MSLLVAHGWNIELGACRDRLASVQPSGWERVGAVEVGTCTLLGPEGPGRLPSGGGVEPLDPFLAPGCVGEGYRPYFENYTVDASILDSRLRSWITKVRRGRLRVCPANHWICNFSSCSFLNSCDFKFLRANGGCLGIWSRRRTS